ncbi:hypothetical protein F5J12DRAFT_964435, partial [Pisolithus orientalis]|uniref:uncharacterized protein n=1 Tax=Pisolithus orientalis TaxID=936130 RepID=UPI002224DF33
MVVSLKEQMRIINKHWMEVLQCARTGECTGDDLATIHDLILDNSRGNVLDFSSPPWENAVLITPCNNIQGQWNELSMSKQQYKTGTLTYIAPAEDTTKQGILTKKQRLLVTRMAIDDPENLPTSVKLAVGMPVIVTENVSTSAGIANGTQGIISNIVLDPREPDDLEKCDEIKLHYPPLYITMKVNRPSQLARVTCHQLP